MNEKKRKLLMIWQQIMRVCTFFVLFCCLLISGFGSNVNFKSLFYWLLYGEEYTVSSVEKPVSEPKEDNTFEPEAAKEGVLSGGGVDIVYYNQNDPRWADHIYGANDDIGKYGCGPTAMAMVVSSLTQSIVDPIQMSKWAYDNGYFANGSGSYHSLIPDSAKSFGLNALSLYYPSADTVIDELRKGRIVVALMAKGHFTSSGHFIILRGLTEDGKILIADPKSYENSIANWDIEIIMGEARRTANSGGPFWSIGR